MNYFMFDTFKNRLEITGVLTTVTALHIGSERSTESRGSDLPVIKDAFGNPLIPGSSFKGALRSRLESFLRGILGDDRKLVANPAVEDEWSINSQEMKKLKEQYQDDLELTTQILQQTDLPSHLFGSPWIASKFQVRDLTVIPEYWFGQYQERDGVSIDRDTGIAAKGKLYDFQVVPAGTQFDFRAVVENATEWELGLLMIGLNQFETEQIPLGGGRSRGLGVVRLDIDQMRWLDVSDNPEKLLRYLQELVSPKADDQLTSYKDGKLLKQQWVESLITHLQEKLPQDSTNTV